MIAERLAVNMIIEGVNYPVGMEVTAEFRSKLNKLPNHMRLRENFERSEGPPPPFEEMDEEITET
jgi:hypothetical protein